MNLDEQNRTLAFALGWQLEDPAETRPNYQYWVPPGIKRPQGFHYTEKPPRYTDSKDDLVWVYPHLRSKGLHIEFVNQLCYLLKQQMPADKASLEPTPFDYITAGAETQVQAALLALNLWKPDSLNQ